MTLSLEPVDLDRLVDEWTLLDGERELVAGKQGTTRIGFALHLRFYGRRGRFANGRDAFPSEVVEFVARQVGVAPELFAGYEFSGRTAEFHRAQIRQHFGFRECTVEDATAVQRWLAGHVAHADPRPEVVGQELLALFRRWRVEPPSDGRIERIVRSAIHTGRLPWSSGSRHGCRCTRSSGSRR